MGSSRRIEECKDDYKEFRDFMQGVEKESEEELDSILPKVDAEAKKYYDANTWENAFFSEDKRSDYQNYYDWSPDNVDRLMDEIGAAINAVDYPSEKVPGSKDAAKSTIEEVKSLADDFSADYSLTILRVKALIGNALCRCSIVSKTQHSVLLKEMPLSAGLHLFFGTSGKTNEYEKLFSEQYLGALQIVYKVFMSTEEVTAIGLQEILKSTELELDFLTDQILTFRKETMESLMEILKKDQAKFLSTRDAYDLMIEYLKRNRNNLVMEYDKYWTVMNTVDHFFSNIDLSDYLKSKEEKTQGKIKLEDLFNPWGLGLAKRYLSEKIN